jgi:hypothetical protein
MRQSRMMELLQRFNVGRLLVAVVLSAYGVWCALTPETYRFFDRLDLMFHEAGHVLMTPFGQFMHMIGGTLGQLFFPVAFFAYFVRSGQLFSASVLLFWVGQSVINVSVYMKDAVKLKLPLLGGEGSIHDWNWIFNELGLIHHCRLIGNVVYAIGFVVILLNVAGMFWFSREETE